MGGCDHRDFDVGQKVRHQMTLFDESVCKYRAVTDLTWSPKVLLLSIAPAGYVRVVRPLTFLGCCVRPLLLLLLLLLADGNWYRTWT